MNERAYLLIDVADGVDARQFFAILKELDGIAGVEFADPVAGSHDIIAIVETPAGLEPLIARLQSKPWLKSVDALHIVSVFERQGA